MNLAIRIVMFLGIVAIVNLTEENGRQIGEPNKISRLLQTILLTTMITVGAACGLLLFLLLPPSFVSNGNEPVMGPLLLGLTTGCFSLATAKLLGRTTWALLSQRQLVVLLPILIVLALTSGVHLADVGDSLYQGGLSLGFFWLCGILSAGIQDRLRIAPIPKPLQGLPIQLILLFLIFLSLSFFRGVFFEEIF